MDTLRLLDQLLDLTVQKPSHLPGIPLYWGLDKDEISLQITKIKASLPQEMKTAANAARESERALQSAQEEAALIVANAERDAERLAEEAEARAAKLLQDAQAEAQQILVQARAQQAQFVSESEILKLTKSQCEEIRNAADRDALQLRRSAEKYAYDVLSQLEAVLGKAMNTVTTGKTEMAPSVDARMDKTVAKVR
jgi:cell division septum initiation protein DivIVA